MQAQKAAEQAEQDKVMAVIEARRKLENAEKQAIKDAAVAEAQERMATELVFDFTFG